jgi:hypothetical protein
VALNTIKQTTKYIYICDATSEKGVYGWRRHYEENYVSVYGWRRHYEENYVSKK